MSKTIVHKQRKWYIAVCGKKLTEEGNKFTSCRKIHNRRFEWPRNCYKLCRDCWERYELVTEIE